MSADTTQQLLSRLLVSEAMLTWWVWGKFWTVIPENITKSIGLWWSCMIIEYDDDHVCTAYLIIIYAHHIWWYTIIIYDHHTWWSYMMLNVQNTSVKQKCETNVRNKCVKQVCDTHVWNKCAKQMCETHVRNKCAKQMCETKICYELNVWNLRKR